jgi:hypothetical protein
MENSPLIYLDPDVSRYLYEKYYPQKKNKIDRIMFDDQFKYFMNFDVYPEFYISRPIPCGYTGGEPTHAIYNAKWKEFRVNKLDKYSYKLFLKYLKKHYTFRMKDNIITYTIRNY